MTDLHKCTAQFDADRKPITGTAQFDAEGYLEIKEGAVYRCIRHVAHGGHCNLSLIHDVSSDGTSVWVNGVGGLLGRFGRAGIDIHQPLSEQQEKGECLFCTHALTSPSDWDLFVAKMKEHFGIEVPAKHMPTTFAAKDRQ